MSVLGLGSDKDESCSNNDDDAPAENAGHGVHDFFGDDDGADYGGAGDFADFGGAGGGDDDNDGEAPFGVDGQDAGVAGVGALFDPRRGMDGKQLFVGMLGDEEGDGMMLDYFDQGVLKNWAGPEHWKLRKVTRKRESHWRVVRSRRTDIGFSLLLGHQRIRTLLPPPLDKRARRRLRSSSTLNHQQP
jgi:condensin complex subunit 2